MKNVQSGDIQRAMQELYMYSKHELCDTHIPKGISALHTALYTACMLCTHCKLLQDINSLLVYLFNTAYTSFKQLNTSNSCFDLTIS